MNPARSPVALPAAPEFEPRVPFRRLAVVLSGGGAMAAYEVGVLRVLEKLRIRPAIVAGVSSGAVNAVLWVAHGFRTDALERVWGSLRASTIGMRWATLALRTVGIFVWIFALLQMVLTLAGSPELTTTRIFWRRDPSGHEVAAAFLDELAWALVAVLGWAAMTRSHQVDEWLAKNTPAGSYRLQDWLGRVVLVGVALHSLTWVYGVPWPHGFSATVLVIGGLVWLTNRPGTAGDWLRRVALRILPETEGRGLWSSAARRRLLLNNAASGDPGLLVDPDTHLVFSALDMNTGRMGYFVNWKDPSPQFRERIEQTVGEVIEVTTPVEVIEAAVASSAIPGVFTPVRIGGRRLVDGGVFSNQPLHVALADDADSLMVVLVSPSGGPPPPTREPNVIEIGARLIELANWRDLQTELRSLPAEWQSIPVDGDASKPRAGPVPLCVIEPDAAIPGGIYGFSPERARELIRRGEADAWAALERAGWIERVRAGTPA